MNTSYLLLGSNIGKSKQQIKTAIKLIEKKIGTVCRQSRLYSTAAWGDINQPDFLNQVIVVETTLTADSTLQTILSIEEEMGRVRSYKNAPRIIDIDILFFNKEIIRGKNLVIPHPEIPNRGFVLVPLNELSPGFVHPVLQQTIHQLLKDCSDKLSVQKN